MDNKKYLTVSSLNKYIKYKIDNDDHLQEVYLKGEISNFKAHSSGHFYFSLKDEKSRIKAIMFRNSANNIKFMPEDGMSVLVKGKVSVYEANGDYQIYVNEMTEDGVGDLYIAFEQMKEKLAEEGLFDPKYKKEIPTYPTRIGVITASTGAAIRDIISTIKRRYPIAEVLLFPALVQGDGAKDTIVKQIITAQDYKLDVLIVGRGGGSIEDMWPFNEEVVARAIFDSEVPIISAVGHEVDFTIADFVADLRAPTPTGAGEMAVPDYVDVINYINQMEQRMFENLKNKIVNYKNILAKIKESYVLKNPLNVYGIKAQKLDNLVDILNRNLKERIKNNKLILDKLISKSEILNPMSALKRGYGIVKKDDKAISSIKYLKEKDKIKIEITDGIISSEILKVEER